MSVTIWEPDDGPRVPKDRVTITVHPPATTKRPVWFVWPDEPKPRRGAAKPKKGGGRSKPS